MTIYSLYVYDRWAAHIAHVLKTTADFTHIRRHCACVYYQDWHRSKPPRPAVEGGILPAVSQQIYPVRGEDGTISAMNSSPRNTLSSSSGVIIAVNDDTPSTPLLQTTTQPTATKQSNTGLSFDEEAKLVYGVVLSLRNIVKKISGRYVHAFGRT
jgi:trafficking protein particle complex subunit 1